MLTRRYSLSPLQLWISSQGLDGGWILKCLRDTIGDVILDEGIYIISDRHTSIENAISAWPGDQYGRLKVFHKYCLRHVTSNFNTHF